MKRSVAVLFIVLLLSILVSCSTTTYKESAFVAGKNLSESFLASHVINDFQRATAKKPVVVIGTVFSEDDVDYSQIVRGFQLSLVASESVELILGSSDRDIIREERIDQLQWGNSEQAKSLANETAADFFGRIHIDPYKGGYIISAEMIDVETGKIVWFNHNNGVVALEKKQHTMKSDQTTSFNESKPAVDSDTSSSSKDSTDDTKNTNVSKILELPLFNSESAFEMKAIKRSDCIYYEARQTVTPENPVMSIYWDHPDSSRNYRIEISSTGDNSIVMDCILYQVGNISSCDYPGGEMRVITPIRFKDTPFYATVNVRDSAGMKPVDLIVRFYPIDGDIGSVNWFGFDIRDGESLPLIDLINNNAVISVFDYQNDWSGSYSEWPYNIITGQKPAGSRSAKKALVSSIPQVPLFDSGSAFEVVEVRSADGTYYEARKTVTADDPVMSFTWTNPDTTKKYCVEITSTAPRNIHIDSVMFQEAHTTTGADIYGCEMKVCAPMQFNGNTVYITMNVTNSAGMKPVDLIFRFEPVRNMKGKNRWVNLGVEEGETRTLKELLRNNAIYTAFDFDNSWSGSYSDWKDNYLIQLID